jgi:hypothetical protein
LLYSNLAAADLEDLATEVREQVASSVSLEEAATKLVDAIMSRWEESTVLARTFSTVMHGRLPSIEREFVRRLTDRETLWVAERTPVLTLLATRGVAPEWNDRRLSRGHLAIPLASPGHVDGIPMVASLMKSLGVAVRAVDRMDASIVTERGSAGLFFVPSAATSADSRSRRIIPAQDFVQRYGVRTVFGFGGAQTVGGAFLATIVFTNEQIPRDRLEGFIKVAAEFKTASVGLCAREAYFTPSA